MKKGYLKKINKLNQGFTLVETLVALSIFSMSILAIMSLLADGISDTGYAKQKMAATYLAQEGIEYIRNMRDTFMLYSDTPQAGWTNFNIKLTNASCQPNFGCYFNPDNLFSLAPPMQMTKMTLTACGSSCPTLLYDATTGKYGYASGINSGLVRKIEFNQISANETKIFLTVFWTQGSLSYRITFSETLFNWIE